MDAVLKAIERVTGVTGNLREYQIQAVTVGEDAQGEVNLEVEHPTGVYRGRAVSTDVIEGSAQAYLDVVNRILQKQERSAAQGEEAAAAAAVRELTP